MAKIILNEFNVRKALKNIKERYGDFDEVRDPWAEGEDAYLMREKLPKGWERVERPDDSPLYRDPDFNEYTKDEYGKFVPVENGDMMESGEASQIPDDVCQDFMNWAMEEADNQRSIGGPKNAVALMWEYYFDDNKQALYDLIQFYKDARGISTEPDSQEDVWVSEEIRRAVNAWGAHQDNYQEDGIQECGPQLCELKKVIKGMIRESLMNMGMISNPNGATFTGDVAEKTGTKKSIHNPSNHHYKTNPKTSKEKRATKRAIVIRWLKKPSVNCAEIMRQLWHPSPEEEDTKRGEFYKKRDGAINKDTGARYYFDDAEINELYRIKSNGV